MKIHYIDPLSRGIANARQALFRPIDIGKWFVVGFTAFLAGLTDAQIVGGGSQMAFRRSSRVRVEEVFGFPERVWDWMDTHPVLAIVLLTALVVLIVVLIIVTWLSARGKFMFLDNVVRNRARVVAPWYEFKGEGNSFFRAHLSWAVLFFAALLLYMAYCFMYLQRVYQTTGTDRELFLPAILAGLGLLAILAIGKFIYIMLRDFVVQVMYRDRVPASVAIQKFLPLFFSQLPHFVGYALLRLLLALSVGLGLLVFGCVTCCIGFLVLAIPYINAVLLLPVSYALRTFSVEFLGQFGPEFDICACKNEASPIPQPPPE